MVEVFCCTLILFLHIILCSLDSSELELVIVSIVESNDLVPLTLALFYRPPSSPYCVLDNLLTVLCTYIDPPCLANFILLGDFNINFFDTSHPLFSKLCLVTNSLSLTQVVNAPTQLFIQL